MISAILVSAVVLASSTAAPTWPLAEHALNRQCPKAEQEELISCAYELMDLADRRIRSQLCRTGDANCEKPFSSFQRKRQATVRRLLDAEGSVSSQLEAAWEALELTLRYEQGRSR